MTRSTSRKVTAQNVTHLAKNDRRYYMYGTHCVLHAIRNPNRKIHELYCTRKVFDRYPIISSFPFKILDSEQIALFAPRDNTQDIVALVSPIIFNSLTSLDCASDPNVIFILDQLQDNQNIGAIMRSAAAFNINSIILAQDKSPEENAVMAKAACGGMELIKIARVVNLVSALNSLKQQGFWVIGVHRVDHENEEDSAMQQTKNYSTPIMPLTLSQIEQLKRAMSGKVAVVLGAEANGIRRLVQDTCDYFLTIPMSEAIDSLNVSVTAGIVMHALHFFNS